LIIRLPGQRELRVDNKVVPIADIPQMGIQMRLDELAEKPYHTQFADNTDWTVLYIPDDMFFANALAADHGLMDRALAQKVLITPPAAFMNLLTEVDTAWTKYREEFPDLGEDEFEGLPHEQRPYLEPGYIRPAGLPPRIGAKTQEMPDGDR
jgi:DNA anti-recombination protein RmuC